MKKRTGVLIDFKGLSYKKRLNIWWAFTLGCLFKKNVKTKYKVKNIYIHK